MCKKCRFDRDLTSFKDKVDELVVQNNRAVISRPFTSSFAHIRKIQILLADTKFLVYQASLIHQLAFKDNTFRIALDQLALLNNILPKLLDTLLPDFDGNSVNNLRHFR